MSKSKKVLPFGVNEVKPRRRSSKAAQVEASINNLEALANMTRSRFGMNMIAPTVKDDRMVDDRELDDTAE